MHNRFAKAQKRIIQYYFKRELASIRKVTNITRIAEAVLDMPFGESIALPWCRESFHILDQAMKDWEQLNN